jgi:phosphonate transport system substrate-binding protein
MLLNLVRIRKVVLQTLWCVVLCAGLTLVAFVAVQIIGRMTSSPEPWVKIFQDKPYEIRNVGSSAGLPNSLRFAVTTMVSAEETFSTYRKFVHKVALEVGREDAFVVRPSYEGVRMALMNGQVDVALVCTGTYLRGLEGKHFKLVAQPEFEDDKEYRSLLLVPADSTLRTWEDLKNKVLAFTDPESFTGCLLPSAELAEKGEKPEKFLKRIIYTGSHDRSIMAVSTHAVDAAAVMSLVWFSALEKQPSLAKQVKVIWQSPVFGPPLIVAPSGLDWHLEEALEQVLYSLNKDKEGQEILSGIGIKRFVPVRPESYATAVKLYRRYEKWLSLQ